MVLYIHSREELENLLITERGQGASIRRLAKKFKLSRNTVRKILRKHDSKRNGADDRLDVKRTLPRPSQLDPFIPRMKELMAQFPNITGQRIFETLRDEGYGGGVTILRERLRKIRPRPKRAPVVRFETEPGVQGQMDWSPYIIDFTRTGKVQVQCFSYILGFSRRHYIAFTFHHDFHTLIRRHQDAFLHFEGVPAQCLYDNEKTVVLRWEGGAPVYNPSFVAFITHYRCRPVACRPGRPQTKGKVEAPFQYVEKNLLNGRRFQDMEDLIATGGWWLKNRSDPHIQNTTGRPPIELFMEQELAALQPLPIHPYDSSEVELRVCRLDGFLEFETNLYSVPYEYVADIVTLKATEHEISIYSPDLKLIAFHERLAAGAGKTVEKSIHRGSKKVRYGLEPVKESFLALGQAADAFLKGLREKHPRNCGFHARFILRLKEKYHCEQINNALARATCYYAFDSGAVERILKVRANPRTLESVRNERAVKELRSRLPKIKQRSLEEYQSLLRNKEKEDENENE